MYKTSHISTINYLEVPNKILNIFYFGPKKLE
jgi:hypothetical protein